MYFVNEGVACILQLVSAEFISIIEEPQQSQQWTNTCTPTQAIIVSRRSHVSLLLLIAEACCFIRPPQVLSIQQILRRKRQLKPTYSLMQFDQFAYLFLGGCMADYLLYSNYIWVSILVPMCAGTGGSWWMFNFAALWHAKHVLSSCIFKSAGKLFPRIMLESLSKWRP